MFKIVQFVANLLKNVTFVITTTLKQNLAIETDVYQKFAQSVKELSK